MGKSELDFRELLVVEYFLGEKCDFLLTLQNKYRQYNQRYTQAGFIKRLRKAVKVFEVPIQDIYALQKNDAVQGVNLAKRFGEGVEEMQGQFDNIAYENIMYRVDLVFNVSKLDLVTDNYELYQGFADRVTEQGGKSLSITFNSGDDDLNNYTGKDIIEIKKIIKVLENNFTAEHKEIQRNLDRQIFTDDGSDLFRVIKKDWIDKYVVTPSGEDNRHINTVFSKLHPKYIDKDVARPKFVDWFNRKYENIRIKKVKQGERYCIKDKIKLEELKCIIDNFEKVE